MKRERKRFAAVAAATVVAAFVATAVYKEIPAMRRYLKIEKMRVR